MIVYHPARRNLAELARKWERHSVHDFVRIQSQPWWWLRWIAHSLAFALSPAAWVVRIGFSNRLEGRAQGLHSLALF
jgi:hypothetical protein